MSNDTWFGASDNRAITLKNRAGRFLHTEYHYKSDLPFEVSLEGMALKLHKLSLKERLTGRPSKPNTAWAMFSREQIIALRDWFDEMLYEMEYNMDPEEYKRQLADNPQVITLDEHIDPKTSD